MSERGEIDDAAMRETARSRDECSGFLLSLYSPILVLSRSHRCFYGKAAVGAGEGEPPVMLFRDLAHDREAKTVMLSVRL